MRGIDPAVRAEQVLPRVYDPFLNERLVRRLRVGRSYGGCLTVDVVGCDMRCSYCYVDGSLLDGRGELLEKEMNRKKGPIKRYLPVEIAEEICAAESKFKWRKNIQITAAEPLLTPEWLVEVTRHLSDPVRKHGRKIWVDTNGFQIAAKPELLELFASYKDLLRFFVSTKNSPKFYTATTRVNKKYCDTGFQCVELMWQKGFVAYPQAPITLFFQPDDFEWYYQRLSRMHPAAPLLLDLDRITLVPFQRIIGGLKQAGLWKARNSQPMVERWWQDFLRDKYRRKVKRLISVDYHPEDEGLVSRFVFNQEPIENWPLFA